MKKSTKQRIWGGLGLAVLTGLAIWISIPQHPSITIGQFHRDLNVKLGLDLQGGTQLIYRAQLDENNEEAEESLAGVRDVIERRVNAFGIDEPNVQTNKAGNEFRVIVELAGVHDPEEAIARIGETPQLDFRRELDPSDLPENINTDSPEGIVGPFFEKSDLTGKHLERATVSFDPVTGIPQVNLEFDAEGTELFATITRENIGKRLAIYLDEVPISAPVVQAEITNGQAVISGGFTLDEAKQLARRLNAGALPVPIELIGQQRIGPSLGRLSIQQSITAGIVGISAVIIWMTLYYRIPGLVSGLVLILYALYFFALVKLLPITLTLAGIAGFIISIGMAVDANVLIFERFRENIRAGKNVRYAMKDGFNEAWDSIQASNFSGLLTGVVLYGFGTSIVRGFALTFALGIILSMFTAITLTRGLLFFVLQFKVFHKPILLGAKPRNAETV